MKFKIYAIFRSRDLFALGTEIRHSAEDVTVANTKSESESCRLQVPQQTQKVTTRSLFVKIIRHLFLISLVYVLLSFSVLGYCIIIFGMNADV